MKRIGMILDKAFPPDPRVENEARVLLDDGHEVYLFCLDIDGKTNEENVNGIQVKRYGSSNFEYKMSALAYSVPVYSWLLRGRIEEFLRKFQIEVIHVHDMVVAETVNQANQSLKLPLVLDLHENRPEIMSFYPHLQRFPGKYLVSIEKWKRKELELINKADRTVVVTEEAKNDLIERTGIESERILIMPNTVSSEFYRNFELNEEIVERYRQKFVLLYIGDTGLRRGLLTAIEGLSLLAGRIPELTLVIVGSNSTDKVLVDRAKQLGVEDRIDFEGWKEENLFASYILASSVCISPLHKNKHHDTTLANKLFQYMGFSRPILASDVLAQEHIIENSKSGLVHRAEDADDFANKCSTLYEDKELRSTLGENGRRFLETDFSLEKVSQSLRSYYRNSNESITS